MAKRARSALAQWRFGRGRGSVPVVSLQIRLLGGLLLESGGRTLPRIPSRPGRSLFAYLVLNRDREVGRDQLTGLFWPDMPDSQARRRLSQALWQVQTLLSEAGLSDLPKTSAAPVRMDITSFSS